MGTHLLWLEVLPAGPSTDADINFQAKGTVLSWPYSALGTNTRRSNQVCQNQFIFSFKIFWGSLHI